jgi:hypothetical protein
VNALVTVVTEATLKQRLRTEQEELLAASSAAAANGSNHHDQNASYSSNKKQLALSNEYAAWTSFFSFIMLMVFAGIIGDLGQVKTVWHPDDTWEKEDDQNNSTTIRYNHDLNSIHGNRQRLIIGTIGLAALVTLSRFAERLSKHFICVCESALTFSVVQAARRMSGVYVLAALFDEAFPTSMMWGSLFVAIGLVGHTWASSWQTPTTTVRDNGDDHHGSTRSRRMNHPKDEAYEMVAITPPTEYDDDSSSSTEERR